MKKASGLFVGITLFSVLSTACGNKASFVPTPFPSQPVQQQPVVQNPVNQQPASRDYYQEQQQNLPDSPDMSNPANSNLNPTPLKNASATSPSQLQDNVAIPDSVPSVQPSVAPTEPEAPPVKVPWYKKIITKVKSIFTKKS
jgi:hypothetical protein